MIFASLSWASKNLMVMHKIKTRTLIRGSCITKRHVILIENVLNNIVLKN